MKVEIMNCLYCGREIIFIPYVETEMTIFCPFCSQKVIDKYYYLPKGTQKEIDARHIC